MRNGNNETKRNVEQTQRSTRPNAQTTKRVEGGQSTTIKRERVVGGRNGPNRNVKRV